VSGLILARAIQAIPLLLLVTVVAFGLSVLGPIDPARMALAAGGTGIQLDERDVARKRVELGLDRPLHERYVRWWADVLHLDFGRSFSSGRPVSELLAQRLPASATLASLALALAVATGIPLGVLVARSAGGRLDLGVRLVALLGSSLPAFWLALLAIWLFAARLHWVPALGSFTPAGIVLPALVLGVRPLGRLLRLVRATTLEVLGLDYVTTARAKGVLPLLVLTRHVLPNTLGPILTVVGLDGAALLANAAVIEWVFAWPGLGRLGVDAALAGDLPVLMAFVLIVGWVVVAINLLVDVASAALDPRQRVQQATGAFG
jgi:ABC-type dipeptide/oligopeptide/nickel transport system permease component